MARLEKGTKIIATLGPSAKNAKDVQEMSSMGADAFRINFSHGTPEEWSRYAEWVRLAEESEGRYIGLIGDLEGPRIRVRVRKPIYLTPGSRVHLTLKPAEESLAVTHKEFFTILDPEDHVLIDDGKIVLRIARVAGLDAEAEVVQGGILEDNKGVAVKGKDVPLGYLSDKDRRDLSFLARHGFSHVMVSFARNAEHIETVRRILKELGADHVAVLAKIETPDGVRNISEIAEVSDGIVIARGDLGMHFPLEEIPVIQDNIINQARKQRKPVILATELLTSMIERPIPTRSEIVALYNAVKQGIDAILLTGETAIGRYPARVVSWAHRVVLRAMETLKTPIYEHFEYPENPLHRIAYGIVELSEALEAPIIGYSFGGRLAYRLSSYKPIRPLYIGVPTPLLARKLSVLWGVKCHVLQASDYMDGLEKLYKKLREEGVVNERDVVVEAAWSREKGVYIIRLKHVSTRV